ncbi:MAG TPA: sodium:solute symporter family protein [Symbiobacteriaceae bacterium]|nr:sodium:solute symporter family protein [Symbiobacteriaceae bacterium]
MPTTTVIPLIIVSAYMVLLLGISWYATKLQKAGLSGYLLANRGFGWAISATMIAGLAIGGSSTVGVAEQAYKVGISAGWYNAAWGTGAIVLGLAVAAKARQFETSTLPELFERYYDKTGRIIAVVGQVTIMMVITALQFVAGGAILASLMPEIFSLTGGMITSAVVFVAITLVGGYWAAGLSNIINVIIIYLGIGVGVVVAIAQYGGWTTIMSKLPPAHPGTAPFSGLGPLVVLAWFLVMIPNALGNQSTLQISFASKTPKDAKWGMILGGLIILPAGFLSAIFGIIAASQWSGLNPTLALPKVVVSLGPWIAGLTLAGLWAADVSTAVGLLMGSSTLVMEDIFKRFFGWKPNEKTGMLWGRVTVAVVALLCFVASLYIRGILSTLTTFLSLCAAYTMILLGTIFLPSLCRRSTASWTLLTGILFLITWLMVPAIRIVPHPIYISLPLAIVTFLAVPMFDSRRATITLKDRDSVKKAG